MVKVINFFAGPGVGKTTTAAGVFYKLKTLGYNVEFIHEFAKELVFENRTDILLYDQLFVLSNQNRNLLNKVFEESLDYVIMESPILLSNIYFNELSIYNEELFKSFTLDLFKQYNNINFYLNRSINHEFNNTGRIHDEYESKIIDINILRYLNENNIPFYKLNINEDSIDKIISLLKNKD